MTPLYQRSDLARIYLPVGQLLQLDRLLEISSNGFRAEVDLENHWAFPIHFPGDPVFPACLQIEAAGQAIAVWAWHHRLAGLPRLVRVEAQFISPVIPADRVLELSGQVRKRLNLCRSTVELRAEGRLVASIAETLWVQKPGETG